MQKALQVVHSTLSRLKYAIKDVICWWGCSAVPSYSNHEYRFQFGSFTWDQAETYCKDTFGGHLASFHSDQEFNAVYDALSSVRGAAPNGWIGLNDLTAEGTFVWSDGTSVVYTNWKSGEPNDAGNNEDCGELTGAKWIDAPCDRTQSAICKRERPPGEHNAHSKL